MKWYHYIACFFAGVLLANVIPHYVSGVSGLPFPTPFANPPGKGLSSPMINTLWALSNLVIGYYLLQVGKVSRANTLNLLIFFAGVVWISIILTHSFTALHQ